MNLGGGLVAWTNPNNVGSTSGVASVAVSPVVGSDTSEILGANTFGFSLPAGVQILGVKVDAEILSTATNLASISLYNSANPIGTVFKNVPTTPVLSPLTFGSATDLWGAVSIDPLNLNGTQFYVTFQTRSGLGVGNSMQVRNVRVTVYFSNQDIVSLADFAVPSGDYLTLWLYSNGDLWQQDTATLATSQIGAVADGCQFRSVTAFNKQWFAFYNQLLSNAFTQSPFSGADVPRYYDGENVWRVTQDAPGANPTYANVPVVPVLLVQTAPTGTVSISAVVSSGPVTYQIHTGGTPGSHGGRGDPGETETITIYTTLTYTATAPVPATWLGTQITVTGCTGTNSSLANVTGTVVAVSGSTFTLNRGTGETFVSLSAQTATGTLAGNYFTRTANIVTAYTGTTAPATFQAGLFAKVINSNATQINGPNWTITSISRDTEGLVTVVISTPLTNLPSGALLYITSVDTTNFPASYRKVFQVLSVTSTATTFTISDPSWGAGGIATSTGTAHQTWSGTFQILSVGVDDNGNNFFTYFQLGPDTNLTSTGGTPQAQIEAQIPPGPRSAVLMFKSVNGAITAPSIPIQLSIAGGTNLLSAQDVPLGPSGTAQRIIALTPAFGASFYYITPAVIPSIGGVSPVLSLGTIIDDNISTTAILDFADAQLAAGTQIDIQGNNLFNQIVLAPCLGCIEYEGRMAWWGEINNIKNMVNMGFDGGYSPVPLGPIGPNVSGNGDQIGSGVSWANPNNVTGSIGFATVIVPALQSSKLLRATQFGFAVPAGFTISGISVTFTGNSTNTSETVTLKLIKSGIIQTIGRSVSIPNSTTDITLGGASDLWSGLSGSVWTPAEINLSTFGVVFLAQGSNTVNIQNVKITIYAVGGLPGSQPLGWDTEIVVNDITPDQNGQLALSDDGLGFTYEMTSGAGFGNTCLISQGAFKNFYGSPIIKPGRRYWMRFHGQLKSGTPSGILTFLLSSASTSLQMQSVFDGVDFSSNVQWLCGKFVDSLVSDLFPDTIPADLIFSVYLSLASTDFTIAIDELEIIDVEQPVLFQQMRLSYFDNPFGYDQTTGIWGIDSSAKITAAFKQRGYLFALTDGPMYQTQNNGQTEPLGWPSASFADECDCFGPNAVTSTEDLSWWAGNSGLRIFSGAAPKKISQEIQPTWDTINKDVPTAVWAVNDPEERCVYIGVPTGENIIPNKVLPMSYRSVDAAYNVPDPLHTSYSGKMIATDLCRKWTRWNIPMRCGAILTRPDLGREMFFGGKSFGNFYSLDEAKFTDDDYGQIFSYYITYFFFNHDIESQAPGLGLHRKIYEYLSASVTGVGKIQITPYVNTLSNPWGPIPTVWDDTNQLWIPSGSPVGMPTVDLKLDADYDLEWPLNVRALRAAWKFAALPLDGQTDAAFQLTHMVLTCSQDAAIPIRGSNIG